MYQWRHLSSTVIHGPWYFGEAAARFRCLHWIGMASNSSDEPHGSAMVINPDDTVQGIRILAYFPEAHAVVWAVVTATSNRGRPLHKIHMEPSTTQDTCLFDHLDLRV